MPIHRWTKSRSCIAADLPRSIASLLVLSLLVSNLFVGPAFADDQPAAEKSAADKPADSKPPDDKPAENKVKEAKQKALAEKVAKAKAKKNAGNQAQAANLAQNWRPSVTSELEFVRHLCPDLPPPQRLIVKAAAEQALLAAADELAGTQDLTKYSGPTPQSMIRAAISEKLREALPAEQWERFTTEAEARVKRRQAAAIRLVIQYVDDSLYLSQDERDQITRAMIDQWKFAWEGWLQLRFMQSVPNLPDEVLLPFLDPEQKVAWRAIAKQNLQVHYITGQMPNGNAADTSWWDEAAPKAKDAAADVPAP